jgi:hypothetical protein
VITNMNQTPQWLYEEVYCHLNNAQSHLETPENPVLKQ